MGEYLITVPSLENGNDERPEIAWRNYFYKYLFTNGKYSIAGRYDSVHAYRKKFQELLSAFETDIVKFFKGVGNNFCYDRNNPQTEILREWRKVYLPHLDMKWRNLHSFVTVYRNFQKHSSALLILFAEIGKLLNGVRLEHDGKVTGFNWRWAYAETIENILKSVPACVNMFEVSDYFRKTTSFYFVRLVRLYSPTSCIIPEGEMDQKLLERLKKNYGALFGAFTNNIWDFNSEETSIFNSFPGFNGNYIILSMAIRNRNNAMMFKLAEDYFSCYDTLPVREILGMGPKNDLPEQES